MIQIRSLRGTALALVLAAGAGTGWVPACAQTGFIAPANPEADRLAAEMRVLAADPRDMRALLEAGMLSARLGDTAAALAFFARAESLDPTNPRILAGRGAALVRIERPGEALRLFQAAEARGLPAREYAADRGLAYDLLGQPLLAQGDYRVALQGQRDDEIVRRFALSLGIAGNVDESMRQLDPLLRRSDRAAWRARAFILAMNGDMPGAERIAASMMPGNMGHSLAPFFRRLANLAPADRAFAVHFGQLSPTAARLADARSAPALPRYVPSARPVQVAQAQPTRPAVAAKVRDRRSRRERESDERKLAPAARRPAPVETAAVAPLPGPPVLAVARAPAPLVQPLPSPKADDIDGPVRPVEVARRDTPPQTRSAITPPAQGGPAAAAAGDTARASERQIAVPAPSSNAAAADTRVVKLLDSARPDTGSVVAAAAAQPVVARTDPAPPGPARIGQEDTVLASIVAGITIPAEELEAVNAAPVELPPAPVASPAASPVVKLPVRQPEPVKREPAKPAPRAEAAKPDPKAKSKKAEAAKPDPKAKKPDPKAKGDPARIWVQVAGGANAASLAKAWKAVTAKAPAAFKGRSGWSTPLRATNRVLTGPFKTAAEAQAFVNTLGKSGVSGFVFTSEAGQKVTTLGSN